MGQTFVCCPRKALIQFTNVRHFDAHSFTFVLFVPALYSTVRVYMLLSSELCDPKRKENAASERRRDSTYCIM